LEPIRQRLTAMNAPRSRWLELSDVLGCAVIFLLVFLSTFPVVVPFLIFDQPRVALRVSNAIALAMLFVCGLRLGSYAGHGPWRMGLLIAALGGVLVAVTIALGG
jgi:VIT1/CCC1 family predicted Fe2+/Mn2+ transporter